MKLFLQIAISLFSTSNRFVGSLFILWVVFFSHFSIYCFLIPTYLQPMLYCSFMVLHISCALFHVLTASTAQLRDMQQVFLAAFTPFRQGMFKQFLFHLNLLFPFVIFLVFFLTFVILHFLFPFLMFIFYLRCCF